MAADRTVLEEIQGKLVCTGFAVSCTHRSRERDSFISLTFGDQHIDMSELPLYVFVAEQKVARLGLVDAVAKGIISAEDQKKIEGIQEKNYGRIMDALLAKRK